MDDDLVANSQRVMLAQRLAPKLDTLQTPVIVSKTEVDVPSR
jgi:hypothetical protein